MIERGGEKYWDDIIDTARNRVRGEALAGLRLGGERMGSNRYVWDSLLDKITRREVSFIEVDGRLERLGLSEPDTRETVHLGSPGWLNSAEWEIVKKTDDKSFSLLRIGLITTKGGSYSTYISLFSMVHEFVGRDEFPSFSEFLDIERKNATRIEINNEFAWVHPPVLGARMPVAEALQLVQIPD